MEEFGTLVMASVLHLHFFTQEIVSAVSPLCDTKMHSVFFVIKGFEYLNSLAISAKIGTFKKSKYFFPNRQE